ncbi:MAG TPA: cytochrome P450 [Solirubrobacterales bacterium]|nr:cytochrome P450 [Solirubrobacterales bacterium]
MIDCLLETEPRPSLEEMLDQIETLLMAAQEPLSIALAWMLDALARHPELAEDYLAAGAGSPLRQAVLWESLRLRPSAERWLGAGETPPVFLPFGGGARRCLGEALARAEAATVAPAVLRALRLKPLWPRRERMVMRGTALVPTPQRACARIRPCLFWVGAGGVAGRDRPQPKDRR